MLDRAIFSRSPRGLDHPGRSHLSVRRCRRGTLPHRACVRARRTGCAASASRRLQFAWHRRLAILTLGFTSADALCGVHLKRAAAARRRFLRTAGCLVRRTQTPVRRWAPLPAARPSGSHVWQARKSGSRSRPPPIRAAPMAWGFRSAAALLPHLPGQSPSQSSRRDDR